MASVSNSTPGIPRTAAWSPTADPANNQILDPVTSVRAWNAFGLIFSGHTIGIDVPTGSLTVSVVDNSMSYQGMPFEIKRTFDASEQSTQNAYLKSHPNTDPRFHFFGNWQMAQEVQVSESWSSTYPELMVELGNGESTLFCRENPHFQVDTSLSVPIEQKLQAFGVPRRTRDLIGWLQNSHDYFLRTIRGPFSILAGQFSGETLVDPVCVKLFRFDPVNGAASRFTSEFGYQKFFDLDGYRETTIQSIMDLRVDAMGHSVSFKPATTDLPYRSYRLSDGSGRSFLLKLENEQLYRDGNSAGNMAKFYTVSSLTDETKTTLNQISYKYLNGALTGVSYPPHGDGEKRQVVYQYDAFGNLTSITDPVGDSIRFEYVDDLLDANDLLIPRSKISRIIDGEGNSIQYNYDHPNREVTVSLTSADLSVQTIVFTYTIDQINTGQRYIQQSTIKILEGLPSAQWVKKTYRYDDRYRLVQSIDPNGNLSSVSYNDFNQIIATSDASGHFRQFFYDNQVYPTIVSPNRYDLLRVVEENIGNSGNTYPVLRQQSFANYTAQTSGFIEDFNQSTHRVASVTDATGNISSYVYDDVMNFNPNNPTSLTDPLGKVSKRTFNVLGAVITQTDALGNQWISSYNAQGRLVKTIDPNGNCNYWIFDGGSDWLVAKTDAIGTGPGDPGHSFFYQWDDAGLLVEKTDAVGDHIKFIYYSNKRLHSSLQYAPAVIETIYSYNAAGALTAMINGSGYSIHFIYDEAGRSYQVYRNDPDNVLFSCERDPAGNPITSIDRRGSLTMYQYDVLNRLVGIKEPDFANVSGQQKGKVLKMNYDYLGNIISISDSQFTMMAFFDYDAAGNLVSKSDYFGFQLLFDYNKRGDLVGIMDDLGIIDFHFFRDDMGNLSKVTDGDYLDSARSFEYIRSNGPLRNNLYRISYDTSLISTAFQYDQNNLLTGVSHAKLTSVLAQYFYNRRPDGVIEKITGDRSGLFQYDGLKRLVAEVNTGLQIGYDSVGNRLWRAPMPVPAGFQNIYDSDNQLLNTPEDGTTYEYDPNGNLATKTAPDGTKTFFYFDGNNRLVGIEAENISEKLLYDLDGKLVQKSMVQNGTESVQRFVYVDKSIIAIADASNSYSCLFTRDSNGRLLRRRTTNPSNSGKDLHSLYFLYDGLGSIARLVTFEGKVFSSISYDAWGDSVTSGTSSEEELFRYRGGLFDSFSGLQNFGQRWYDHNLGRWISADPSLFLAMLANIDGAGIAEELKNLYIYVSDNPLNANDATGLGAWGDFIDRVRQSTLGALLGAWIRGGQIDKNYNVEPTISDSVKEDAEKTSEKDNGSAGNDDKVPDSNGDPDTGKGSNAVPFIISVGGALLLLLLGPLEIMEPSPASVIGTPTGITTFNDIPQSSEDPFTDVNDNEEGENAEDNSGDDSEDSGDAGEADA